MASFASRLQRASWRGVPFGVEGESSTHGRRLARHDYPYRDTIWLEDQGKQAPGYRVTGFLVGDSQVYGGGDVIAQRKAMQSAAEATGQGALVHPSLGRKTVNLVDLVITSRWDEGNYFELQFTFVEGGGQLFPAVLAALGDLVGKAAGLADLAGVGDFVSKVTGPLQQGLDAATSMASTAGAWIDQAQSLARDATSLYGTVSQLGGADFGRYFNGRNAGFLSGLVSPYAGASSIADLIGAGAAQRQLIGAAASAVTTAIGGLNVGTAPADVASAVQLHVAAIANSAADPADGLRILAGLTGFKPAVSAASSVAGGALGDLYRRAAAVAMARVSAGYAPSSADDASAARMAVTAPLDAEIEVAGNNGADEVFTALRSVRKAVTDDLGQRGGALARLIQIELPQPLPAVVIAAMKYADANRGAELVTQADPIHPWFMPTSFTALAPGAGTGGS